MRALSDLGSDERSRRLFLFIEVILLKEMCNSMKKIKAFLKRKDVIFSVQRYGIDALSAMAQGLFCTLLVGTILNTLGQQFHIDFLNRIIITVGSGEGAMSYTIGGLASSLVGPGIAVAIGVSLNCPNMVLPSPPEWEHADL